MNYIIFDLEATCWKQRDNSPNETIEIGAVMIDEKRQVVGEFEKFIQPIKHPRLSDFCMELTSIRQEDVDNAAYFNEVIEDFQDWIQQGDNDYLLCSWGFYDRKQFESDSQIYGLDTAWLEKHISLKHEYARINSLRRAIGMKRALIRDGITLEGTHHRGIDDARNISKIFIRHFDDWSFNA